MRKTFVVFMFVTTLFAMAFHTAVHASTPASLPSHPLITATVGAETPQVAVGIIIDAFNDPANQSSRQNFAVDHALSVIEGEVVVLGTDWGTSIPTNTLPVNTEGGYGVWVVAGPWTGTVMNGVGVWIASIEGGDSDMSNFYLPLVMR